MGLSSWAICIGGAAMWTKWIAYRTTASRHQGDSMQGCLLVYKCTCDDAAPLINE